MYVHYGTRELEYVGEFTRYRGDYMVKIAKKHGNAIKRFTRSHRNNKRISQLRG